MGTERLSLAPSPNPSPSLDHVHLVPGSAAGAGTFFADARDDQAVARHAEAVLAGHFVAQLDQLFVLEFEEPVALRAVEVVVLGIAVVVLIDGPAVEDELAQQARIDEFAERAIDGRPADVPFGPARRELLHELVGVEMLVSRKDVIDQGKPLLGHPHAAALEIFHEPVAGRKRDGDVAQRGLFGHNGTKCRVHECNKMHPTPQFLLRLHPRQNAENCDKIADQQPRSVSIRL